ncbi:beta strand repeat-containing protein [Herbiconiux sp. YIM B11900]|uniref:beta strand repeat-containing protein n=1 Tax=Herbiconiux sp. YIM B11900 TaxID=3404131 RepID=UPI003F86A4CF
MTRSLSVRRRIHAGGAGVALAAAALIATPVAPAFAEAATVSTIGQLQTALADCATAPNTIVLGADISAPRTAVNVPCDTVIDLGTHDLSVLNVVIAAGKGLTVEGPTDGTGGTLAAIATGAGGATPAIQTSGATLTVTGGTVVARGAESFGAGIGGSRGTAGGALVVAGGIVNAYSNAYGAAVGGGYPSGAGGTVEVTSGALNAYAEEPFTVAVGGAGQAFGSGGAGAQVTVTGGVLTASTSSGPGTAIGGGISGFNPGDLGGAGGSLTIGAGGEVVVTGPRNAIGAGWGWAAAKPTNDFGSVTVDGILRLPSGQLYVGTHAAAGPEITVGPTGRILGSVADPAAGAGITGPGTIDNQGTITLNPMNSSVTGNNRLVRFSPAVPSVRVFAPSFTDGARTVPAPPAGTLWNTAPDGSGDWFTSTSSTAGSGTLDLYGVAPASIAVSTDPAALTATAGEPYDFPVTVNGLAGSPLVPQPAVDYASADCTIGAGGVFAVARSCSITASTTVQGALLQKTFTIQVAPGPLSSMAIAPASDTVAQGASVAFLVTGSDAEGNAVDVDAAVLTSSSPADSVSGRSVTFSGAGDRTVTASLGSLTATAAVTVVAGPLSSLSITPTTATIVQGSTVDFTVTGTDAGGNPVDTSNAVLTSSADTDSVSGDSVTFSEAGPRFVTATLSGVTTSATVEVVAGPLATLSLTPPTISVVHGGTVVYTVSGADSAGNPVDATAAVLSSSNAADTIDGRAVTFSDVGAHTVSAALAGVTTTASVEVVAGPLATLTLTPEAASVVQGGTQEFVVAGADAAGNPVDTSDAVLTSSAAADTVAGRTIAFSGAGAHTVTATLGSVVGSASITVSPGPLASLSITPSSSSVDQGGTVDFAVTGTDAAGNPVDTSDAVLTSSVTTDVVNGFAITFPHASPHTVTATLGSVSASVTIEVVPGPAPSPGPTPASLANTGFDGSAAGLTGGAALACLLVAGVLLLLRRTNPRSR